MGHWEFCPQSNLEPKYLDKEANHLVVSKFCQNLRTYIDVDFRGVVPANVWMYISPFISSSWWSSLEKRKVKVKGLEDIRENILEDSSIINPGHSRRMDMLKEKRPNSGHSDFPIN